MCVCHRLYFVSHRDVNHLITFFQVQFLYVKEWFDILVNMLFCQELDKKLSTTVCTINCKLQPAAT